MTRIRYNKSTSDPNLLTATSDILLPNGQLVQINLNTEEFGYTFLDVNTREIVSVGVAKNLMAVKKLVRDTLLELGVPLEKEVKNFKKNVTGVAA